MARSVADAAIMLGVLESAAPDPNDPATSTCMPPPGRDYTRFLDRNALKGARIGVPRAFFFDPVSSGSSLTTRGGLSIEQKKVMQDAISDLTRLGAIVVDPANIPSVVDWDPARNFLDWPVCSGPDHAKGKDANCSTTYKYGMKRDFNTWLSLLGDRAPVKSLTELRAWNEAHRAGGALKVQASRISTTPMKLTSSSIVLVMLRTAGRTCCSRRSMASTRS